MQPIIPVGYLGASDSLNRKGPTMLLGVYWLDNVPTAEILILNTHPVATPKNIEALHNDFSVIKIKENQKDDIDRKGVRFTYSWPRPRCPTQMTAQAQIRRYLHR